MSAATLAKAREQWADARPLPDAVLQDLLDASWSRCLAFLPPAVVAGPPAFVPSAVPAYVLANTLDARDLWNAARRDGDVIGFDQYAVRVRPLSDTVRSLLRPSDPRPQVG